MRAPNARQANCLYQAVTQMMFAHADPSERIFPAGGKFRCSGRARSAHTRDTLMRLRVSAGSWRPPTRDATWRPVSEVAMIRSFGRLSLLIIQAIAFVFISMTTSTAAGQTPEPQAGTPNWEHVRTIGGRLGVPRTLTIGGAPARTIAIGDFDGDGNADIAVGGGSGQVTVFRGDGVGGFQSAASAARADWATVDAITAIDGTAYSAASSAVASSTALRVRGRAASPGVAQAACTALSLPISTATAWLMWPPSTPARRASRSSSANRVAGAGAGPSRSALGRSAVALASGDFDGDGAIDSSSPMAAPAP